MTARDEAESALPAPDTLLVDRECSWCEEVSTEVNLPINEGMCFRCWKAWATPTQLKARGLW